LPVEAENFSLRHSVQTDSGTNPATYPVDTQGTFPGGEGKAVEDDHSSPTNPEVKNAWSYTSTPPYIFMAWSLVKHRGNFILSVTVFFHD
jgi:hypothetical protein